MDFGYAVEHVVEILVPTILKRLYNNFFQVKVLVEVQRPDYIACHNNPANPLQS